MRSNLIIIFYITIFSISSFAQKFTISGTLKDSVSGETLIGVEIFLDGTSIGTVSNNYGFYSLNIGKGEYRLVYQLMGYKNVKVPVNLVGNVKLDQNLQSIDNTLTEVVVSAEQNKIKRSITSKNTISVNQLKSIPSITGEPDVLKSLQLLPGVQTSGEGSTNLIVRGGNYDENLILLDETPVYNPSHALGFFSAFQPDAVKNIELYKGCFPAHYGGRLSSIVDISTKEGNQKKNAVISSLGLLSSSLSIEGPIIKNKMSFIISARYGYPGQSLNFFAGDLGKNLLNLQSLQNFNTKTKIDFYDLNAKINYIVNEKNRIYLSAYTGSDHFFSYSIDQNNQLDWGNKTVTMRWNQIYNSRWFSNLTLYNSQYNYSYVIFDDIRHFKWKSLILETGLKYDVNFYVNTNNLIRFGYFGSLHVFKPGSISPTGTSSIVKPLELDRKKGFENAFYIENEQKLSSKISLNYGVRYSNFLNLGSATVYKYSDDMQTITDSTKYSDNEIIQSFRNFEPRVTLNWQLDISQSLKLGFGRTAQYLHLLSNSTVGLPTDLWLPPDNYLTPQTSNQYTIGYYKNLVSQKLELSVELYYKSIFDVIDFKDNADLFMNKYYQTQVLSGNGKSYGLEILLEKKIGKFKGWLSYTLAKTTYKIKGINQNREYSPRFDIRHNISIFVSYPINQQLTISSSFKITSGGFITIPAGSYFYDGVAFPYYTERNGYALPAYHRLDLALKYQSKKNLSRKLKTEWNISIYNVYNHKNIYALFVRTDSDLENSHFYKMYLGGIVPTISFNIKF